MCLHIYADSHRDRYNRDRERYDKDRVIHGLENGAYLL